MQIEFFVQGQENYGTPERPYWKMKSAGDYLLPIDAKAFETAADQAAFLHNLAESATRKINSEDAMWRQHVIDWHLVEDTHYTEFELQQLEYEGVITTWAQTVELEGAAA